MKKLKVSGSTVYFQKGNHGCEFPIKSRKQYLRLKFRFEQQGYIEIEKPVVDENTITIA